MGNAQYYTEDQKTSHWKAPIVQFKPLNQDAAEEEDARLPAPMSPVKKSRRRHDSCRRCKSRYCCKSCHFYGSSYPFIKLRHVSV
jgi:hypothetical protein